MDSSSDLGNCLFMATPEYDAKLNAARRNQRPAATCLGKSRKPHAAWEGSINRSSPKAGEMHLGVSRFACSAPARDWGQHVWGGFQGPKRSGKRAYAAL